MWVLISAILVLGITVVALISVFDSYNTSQQQMSVQNVQSAVSTSISAINTAFAQHQDFSGFNGTVAKQIGAIPSSWADAGNGNYALPGGGEVSFGYTQVNSSNNNAYTIKIFGVNQQTCAQMATFSVPQMAQIQINANSAFQNPAYYSGADPQKWPPKAVDTAGQCAPTNNTVTYTLI